LNHAESIKEALPGKPCIWQDFKQFGIGTGQSTMERYDKLVKSKALVPSFHSQTKISTDDHHPNGVLGIYPDMPDQPASTHENVITIVEEAVEEIQTRSPDTISKVKVAGRSTHDLLEELDVNGKDPIKMDWKTAIQLFVQQKRRTSYTFKRPPRRFLDRIGEIPGRTNRVHKDDKPKILVAIDTSASMSRGDLEEVISQFTNIRKFAHITIIECDVKIQRVYPFDGNINQVCGRGGTDFRPVFEPGFLRPFKSDGIIYFTDGCGPYPEKEPAIKTLWVLTDCSHKFKCPWGEKVNLNARTIVSSMHKIIT